MPEKAVLHRDAGIDMLITSSLELYGYKSSKIFSLPGMPLTTNPCKRFLHKSKMHENASFVVTCVTLTEATGQDLQDY